MFQVPIDFLQSTLCRGEFRDVLNRQNEFFSVPDMDGVQGVKHRKTGAIRADAFGAAGTTTGIARLPGIQQLIRPDGIHIAGQPEQCLGSFVDKQGTEISVQIQKADVGILDNGTLVRLPCSRHFRKGILGQGPSATLSIKQDTGNKRRIQNTDRSLLPAYLLLHPGQRYAHVHFPRVALNGRFENQLGTGLAEIKGGPVIRLPLGCSL